MFVVYVNRLVKVNISHTADRFSPRTANQTRLTVSGPFTSIKAAQLAAIAAMGQHTCLDAQIASEEQVRADHAKGSSLHHGYRWDAIHEAKKLLDAVHAAAR